MRLSTDVYHQEKLAAKTNIAAKRPSKETFDVLFSRHEAVLTFVYVRATLMGTRPFLLEKKGLVGRALLTDMMRCNQLMLVRVYKKECMASNERLLLATGQRNSLG